VLAANEHAAENIGSVQDNLRWARIFAKPAHVPMDEKSAACRLERAIRMIFLTSLAGRAISA